MGITFTFYIKQNYIPVNIGVLSFNIFYYKTGHVCVQRKKFLCKICFSRVTSRKIPFIILVTQTDITLNTCFNTPEVSTKDCFYKTAIVSNLQFCLK